VTGTTQMGDFRLDRAGTPVELDTEFSATVDGTNGDTRLHPVRARLGESVIVANGSIVRGSAKHGRLIQLKAAATDARIEDMLRLVLGSDRNAPLLIGPVDLTTTITIPPEDARVIDKLVLDGNFSLDDAHWGNPTVVEKLEGLSRRAQGQPEDDQAGSSVSDLKARFHLEKGVIRFSSLEFSVPGAKVALDGNYRLRDGALDFTGEMRMDARLSEATTGAKSVLLKLIDPFFAKDGAGAVLPIRIEGTRERPQFGLNILRSKK
jgi:hypothetical protein